MKRFTCFYIIIIFLLGCNKKNNNHFDNEKWHNDSARVFDKLLDIHLNIDNPTFNYLKRIDSLEPIIKKYRLHHSYMRMYNSLYNYYENKENHLQMERVLNKAKKYADQHPDSVTQSIKYYLLGIESLYKNKDKNNTIIYLFTAADLAKTNNLPTYENVLSNLASISIEAEDYKTALDLNLKKIKSAEKRKKPKYNHYLYLSEIYSKLSQYSEQLAAIRVADKIIKDKSLDIPKNYHYQYALYYKNTSRLDSAQYYINKEIGIGKKMELVDYIDPQILKAQIFEQNLEKDSLQNSVNAIEKMLPSFENDYGVLKRALPLLIKYGSENNKRNYQQQYIEVLEKISQNKFGFLAAQYNYRSKEKELTNYYELKEEKQKRIINIVILSSLIAVLLVIMIVLYLKNKNNILSLSLLNAKLETTQEERNRISQELHDDLGANFTSIKLASELMKEKHPDIHVKELDIILKNANAVHEKLREIIWSFNTNNDTLKNFIAYCRKFAVEFLENSPITLQFINETNQDQSVYMNALLRRRLYLVIKEITHNTVKHAQAKTLKMVFTQDGQQLTIVLQDDGKGISVEQNNNGNGLHNIRKNIDILKNSEINVLTGEQGTTYTITTKLE